MKISKYFQPSSNESTKRTNKRRKSEDVAVVGWKGTVQNDCYHDDVDKNNIMMIMCKNNTSASSSSSSSVIGDISNNKNNNDNEFIDLCNEEVGTGSSDCNYKHYQQKIIQPGLHHDVPSPQVTDDTLDSTFTCTCTNKYEMTRKKDNKKITNDNCNNNVIIVIDDDDDDDDDEVNDIGNHNSKGIPVLDGTETTKDDNTMKWKHNPIYNNHHHNMNKSHCLSHAEKSQPAEPHPIDKKEILILQNNEYANNDNNANDSDDDQSNNNEVKDNPFSRFVFNQQEQHNSNKSNNSSNSSSHTTTQLDTSSSILRNDQNITRINTFKYNDRTTTTSSININTKYTRKTNAKQKTTRTTATTTKPTTIRPTKKSKSKEKDDIPFHQMTNEQKTKCKLKWQSFADENAPLEIKRFQVLIAARLHCQAHESVVRSSMDSLKEYIVTNTITANTNTNNKTINQKQIFLDANTLSKANPQEVAKIISSVLFANVKAKQIVKAATEVKMRFHGIVPESEHGLKLITGVGPKLAEVLYHVNGKKDYL